LIHHPEVITCLAQQVQGQTESEKHSPHGHFPTEDIQSEEFVRPICHLYHTEIYLMKFKIDE
jgi:hypothetical protein